MSYTILERIKIQLREFHIENVETEDEKIVFDKPENNPFIEEKILKATQDVANCRRYPKSYTTEKIENDLKEYENVIIDLVMYDLIKEGGEYQDSSSENGTSRGWVKRETLMRDVTPLTNF